MRSVAYVALLCSIGCASSSSHAGGDAGAQGGSGASAQGGTSSGGTNTGGNHTGGTNTGGTHTGGSGPDASVGGAGGSGTGGFPDYPDAGPSSGRQKAVPLGGSSTAPNGYYEYLPPGYDESVARPLLVFWHGIGEDGNGSSDLSKVLAWGPPSVISKDQWDNSRPFIVLSPQYTATNGQITPGGGCPSSATVDTFFTWAIGHYKIDPKRVYLTGLSCGAIGSWDYLADHRGAVVAAAVLLSGNPGDPTQAGSAWGRAHCALGETALWSFHGDADGTVPYAPDKATLDDVIACPAPPRRAAVFTDVVGGGHIIWAPIYDLSGGYGDIYAWMLKNAKP